MAKKRSGTSLSQHIRNYLKDNRGATPNQIVDGLAAQGVTVSAGLASNVKYTSSQKGKRKMKAARQKAAGDGAPTKKTAGKRSAAALSAQDLFEAKKLADELGGIAAARKALDALEKLK
jgi:hypothetical protein